MIEVKVQCICELKIDFGFELPSAAEFGGRRELGSLRAPVRCAMIKQDMKHEGLKRHLETVAVRSDQGKLSDALVLERSMSELARSQSIIIRYVGICGCVITSNCSAKDPSCRLARWK